MATVHTRKKKKHTRFRTLKRKGGVFAAVLRNAMYLKWSKLKAYVSLSCPMNRQYWRSISSTDNVKKENIVAIGSFVYKGRLNRHKLFCIVKDEKENNYRIYVKRFPWIYMYWVVHSIRIMMKTMGVLAISMATVMAYNNISGHLGTVQEILGTSAVAFSTTISGVLLAAIILTFVFWRVHKNVGWLFKYAKMPYYFLQKKEKQYYTTKGTRYDKKEFLEYEAHKFEKHMKHAKTDLMRKDISDVELYISRSKDTDFSTWEHRTSFPYSTINIALDKESNKNNACIWSEDHHLQSISDGKGASTPLLDTTHQTIDKDIRKVDWVIFTNRDEYKAQKIKVLSHNNATKKIPLDTFKNEKCAEVITSMESMESMENQEALKNNRRSSRRRSSRRRSSNRIKKINIDQPV